jgi:hypothetical protein
MKGKFLIAATLIFSFFILACEDNIFQSINTVDENNFDDCMSKANAAYKASDFAAAKQWYLAASELDPKNSDARYGVAKASMRFYGIDVFSVAMNLMDQEEGDPMLGNMDTDDIIDIYNGTKDAQTHIHYIAMDNCTSGKIKPGDVYYDDFFTTSLKAISTICKTMNDIDAIVGEFEVIVSSDGIDIADWENLDPEKQQEIIDDIDEILDDAEAIIPFFVDDPEEQQNLLDLINDLKNIGAI